MAQKANQLRRDVKSIKFKIGFTLPIGNRIEAVLADHVFADSLCL